MSQSSWMNQTYRRHENIEIRYPLPFKKQIIYHYQSAGLGFQPGLLHHHDAVHPPGTDGGYPLCG